MIAIIYNMEEKHEIIEFSPNIPMKFFMERLGYVGRHWHSSIELLMVLDGTVTVTVDEETSQLNAEDILLVNANSIHELRSERVVMVALQVDLAKMQQLDSSLKDVVFDCNSAKNPDPARYQGIRFALARLARENSHNSPGIEYRNYALAYYLIGELLRGFVAKSDPTARKKQKHIDRMDRILSYIQEHYAENFTLRELADAENLTVPYLSSFFDKTMGVKFSDYYLSVKLEHAEDALLHGDQTIEEIAVTHGFGDAHSFIRSFKKQYGMTPTAYRKAAPDLKRKAEAETNMNYLLVEPGNYLHLLTDYLPEREEVETFSGESRLTEIEEITVEPVSPKLHGQRLRHTFKNYIAVGRAKELLNSDIQKMLIDLQREIGFRYVKFHGLLSDDMMVVNRVNGKLKFHYTLVDMVLDFLLSIGLTPMIQLSFMPRDLAENPEKTVFRSPFITSPPRHTYEWEELVTDFTKHLLARYGEETVVSFPFAIWNEPMTGVSMFGFGDDHRFFRFYAATFRAVKAVCPKIQIGSPSTLYIENLGGETWIRNFVHYAEKHDCIPDFLNVHYYADIFPDTAGNDVFIGLKPSSSFPKRTDDFSLWIGSVKRIFASLGLKDLPVYMTEWNFTFSHRNLINDTCFKSCWILKNLLKNYDRLESFGYWSLTDLVEENAIPDTLFHGGLGIYTMNGLRKNVFYAFYFANMLGDELLSFGDGYFITKRGDAIQIITYHYVHYGNLFASGEMFDITDTHRYAPFDMSKRLRVVVPIEELQNGDYEIREYFVNRSHGSAYDIWLSLGAVPLDPHDTDLLRGLCVPGYHKELRLIDHERLKYEAILDPLEIRFAEVKRVER